MSDLTSPVRERRVELRFDGGEAVGHFAATADDEYARLTITSGGAASGGTSRTEIFPDDALTAFMLRVYQDFSGPGADHDDLAIHADVVRLLAGAKQLAAARTRPAIPAQQPAADLSVADLSVAGD